MKKVKTIVLIAIVMGSLLSWPAGTLNSEEYECNVCISGKCEDWNGGEMGQRDCVEDMGECFLSGMRCFYL